MFGVFIQVFWFSQLNAARWKLLSATMSVKKPDQLVFSM